MVKHIGDTFAGAKRTLTCSRCGAGFGCRNDGSGTCWCGEEAFRLPMPLPEGVGPFGDCLCPDCIRAVAADLMERPEFAHHKSG